MMSLVADGFFEMLNEVMKDESTSVVEVFRGECTYAEVKRVYEIAKEAKVTVFLFIFHTSV